MNRYSSLMVGMPLLLGACASVLPTHAPHAPISAKADKALLVNGSEGLPDLDRGIAALRQGRLDDAERDLRKLAIVDYVEAQMALAELYRSQTPPNLRLAEYWLDRAYTLDPAAAVPLARLLLMRDDTPAAAEADRILQVAWYQHADPLALPALVRLYTAYPKVNTSAPVGALVGQAEARSDEDARSAVIGWYRSTADVEGHRSKLLALCRRDLADVPSCFADLLEDARSRGDIAATGDLSAQAITRFQQGQSLPPVAVRGRQQAAGRSVPTATTLAVMARILVAPADAFQSADSAMKPAPVQTELADQLLAALLAGNFDAQLAAAEAIVGYPFLRPDANVEVLLKAGADAHLPHAELALGRLYLEGKRATLTPRLAERYLLRATQSPTTAASAHYLLGRLYADGTLDEVDPPKAVEHLLVAARQGQVAADADLTRLFFNGLGVRVDLVNAYVFASLAAAQPRKLAIQVAEQMTIVDGAHGRAMPQQRLHVKYRPDAASVDPLSADPAEEAPEVAPALAPDAAADGIEGAPPEALSTTAPPTEKPMIDLLPWLRTALSPEQLQTAEALYQQELSVRATPLRDQPGFAVANRDRSAP